MFTDVYFPMQFATKSRSRSLPNHYRSSSRNRFRNASISMYATPQVAPRPYIQPIINSYYSPSQSSLNSASYQHSINPSIYQNQSYASSFPNYHFRSNQDYCNTLVCCPNYTNNNSKSLTASRYDTYCSEKCNKHRYYPRYENTLEYLKLANLDCQKNDFNEINNNDELSVNRDGKFIGNVENTLIKNLPPVVKFNISSDVIKEENYGDI